MQSTLDQRIGALAARQHGIFSMAQADGIGFTRAQRDARIRAGRWIVPYERVYRIAGSPESWRGRVLAACWAAHGLALASHRSGAELWDVWRCTDLVEITCDRWRRAKATGLVVHETKLLDPADVRMVDGIPTASIEQTLLGLAAVVDESVVEIALDRALTRKLTTIPRVEAFVRRKGKRGRNGVGVLRGLVAQLDPLAGVPESAMETKLKRLLRAEGLPMPQFQYEIRHEGRFVARVDAAYPALRIAIEYDSYEHHTGRVAIDRDNERRARIARAGWNVVTFTAASIRSGGGEALVTLRALLAFGAPDA